MHVPVLLEEALGWLAPRPGGCVIDATLGSGGHAEAILERSAPSGRVLGLDADPGSVARCRKRLARFGGRFEAEHTRFSMMAAAAAERGINAVDGVLMDLGVSSEQLDDPERGFSFRSDGPLDMRMNPEDPVTAADLVAGLDERDLEELLRRLGEEPDARRMARRIAAFRRKAPIRTTGQLAAAVSPAARSRRPGRHPATRVFQALRLAVNRELEELGSGLDQALALLRPGGRLVAISFHSLEDRIVKQGLLAHAGRRESLPGGGERVARREPPVRLLTRRPVRPGAEERARNPRSRSARLRAAERIG